MKKSLFDATNIGMMELKNRIVFLPLGTCLVDQNGYVTDDLIRHYALRAAGGAGLVTVEPCIIDPGGAPPSIRLPRIYDDAYAAGLSRLARGIQKNGAKAAVQLSHAGASSSPQPVGPSSIRSPHTGGAPRELLIDEIHGLVERFAECAKRAQEIGFDAVEFHGAHRVLISSFFSPFTNRRSDEYGGDVRNCARFGVEIIRRTRDKVGKDFPLIMRINADEHLEGGLSTSESAVIAQLLEEAGIDAISASSGRDESMQWSVPPMIQPIGCEIPATTDIKKAVRIPVIAAGRLGYAKIAKSILDKGSADFIGLGRGLLADPYLPIKFQQGLEKNVTPCIACNSCLNAIFNGLSLACIMNPDLPADDIAKEITPAPKRVLVIGACPAGLEAARIARLRGHEVTLYEHRENIGGRWSWRIKGYIQNSLKVLKGLGVPVNRGVGIDPKTVADLHPDVVLVAAAGQAIIPAYAKPKGGSVYTVEEALAAPERLGRHVAVLGGNNAACEAAETFSRKGKQVTMLNSSKVIGHGLEHTIRLMVKAALEDRGVTVVNQAEVIGLAGTQVAWRGSDGRNGRISADAVVLALGYEANEDLAISLREQKIEVHILPFCETPRDVLRSIRQGAAVARLI